MTRPTKVRWAPLQNIWLQVVWETGYHITMIAVVSGRTEIAIHSRVRTHHWVRPAGCWGLGAKAMQARLAPIPPFPGGSPVEPRPARAENRKVRPDGSHSAQAAKEPPEDGWSRRCPACEGIFKTDDVEVVHCGDCRASFGIAPAKARDRYVDIHVRRVRLDRDDTWLSR